MNSESRDAPLLAAGQRRLVRWPEGQRIALTVSVAFEAFEQHSQYRQEFRPGIVDYFSLSFAEYGANVGLWRLLDFFGDEGIPLGFSISGLAAKKYPEAIQAIRHAGHELVGHGWANDLIMGEDPQAEAQVVADTLSAIAKAAGVRPRGWSGPGNQGSPETKRILAEERLLWTGDDASDDVPFIEDIDGRPLVIMPKTNIAANDLVQWMKPANSPRVFVEGFQDTFDTLYAEGAAGMVGWCEIVVHCHMGGRPAFIPALREVIRHAKRHSGVWWTRKGDIAQWTLEQGYRR